MRGVVGLLLVFLLACGGGGGGGGGPTGPEFPNLRGIYDGSWTVVFREASSGATFTFSCPGSVTVTSQSGGGFSGTFTIRSTTECDAVFGTVTGTVRPDGGITLSVDVPGGDPNPFADLTGCTVIGGDASFAGAAQGSQMSIHATVDTDCELEGQVFRITWTITFQGSK